MGNETSVPEDDGLQPPSQLPPPSEARAAGKAFKAAKAVLQKTAPQPNPLEDKFYPAEQYALGGSAVNGGGNMIQGATSFHSGDGDPTIPVMFASSERSQAAAQSIRTGGKAVRNGGRALINSMRNLTVTAATKTAAAVGTTVPLQHSSSSLSQTGTPFAASPSSDGLHKEEKAWESQWEEDDADDSDDDDDDVPPAPPLLATKELAPQALLTPTTPSSGLPQLQNLDWNEAPQSKPIVPTYEKPNVQMFLPLLRVLGKGSFGKVVLCKKNAGQEQGTLFAMKMLRKTHLVKKRQIERTRTERKVLSVVDHPFIMKLHYAFQTEDKLYLVLDYCPGGELFFHLSRFRRFPEKVAKFYCAELLLAIGHLHKRGIIYRDLKPENVLLDADGHVKLGDFGLAKAGIRHYDQGALSMCGTPEYMAPEVLNQQNHGFCVDYWGLGMLTFEMMTGLPPWYTTDRGKLFRRLKSSPLEIPNYFSPQAASCVSQLLQRDVRLRLGATGIRAAMEHEFFENLNWRALYARRVKAPIHPCEGWDPMSSNNIGDAALDAATANFDNAFTRMKVESEDHPTHEDHAAAEELHANTFVGFTFDVEAPPSSSLRQRSQALE